MSKPRPVGRPATYSNVENLAQFVEPTTLANTGVSVYIAKRLVDEGLLRQVGVVKTEKQGRPAHIYKATAKAVKRVKRAEKVAVAA